MLSHGGRATHLFTRAAGRARRLGAVVAVTGLALAGLSIAGASAGAATAARARAAAPGIAADDTTASQNNLRDGWDPNEPTLTPAVVSGGTFGEAFKTAVKGQVYAQPLVIGSTVIVATEQDWVYGLNATTGAILWSDQLGPPMPMSSCNNLEPDIGITATPVYDPSTNTVYVMALVKEISFEYHLFGINASTGAITLKQRIAGTASNDSHITFNAVTQNQRVGLLLMNGWVYAGFASYCDHGTYNGFIGGVNVTTHATTLWTDESGNTDTKGGVWQSGGGIMSDGSGRIFVTSGNGVSPAKGPGTSPPGNLAESVIRLAPQSNGSLSPQDFFSPANAPTLDAGDVDYGAGGPVELPVGTSTFPNVIVQAGKDGHIFLLNANNLGGREQAPNNGNANLFRSHPIGGVWGHPAVFEASTSALPASTTGTNDDIVIVGKNDNMREFQINTDSTDTPNLTDVANSSATFGYTSGSPVITSNGTDPSSAIIWIVNSTGGSTGSGGELDAYDLVPSGGKLTQIFSKGIGTASKFTIPATSNGMVYVGTRDGNVYGFGVTGAAALKSSGTVTYPGTQVGSSSSAPATVTATRTVTVTSASVSAPTTPAPYTLGQVTETGPGSTSAPVTFPVTLNKGDALHASVAFAPTAPGGASAQVTFATSTGPDSASVPLVGDGLKTGLYATNPAMSFLLFTGDGSVVTNVPVGISDPQVTDIVNGGASPVTVTSVTPPAAPYTAQYLPTAGTVIKPGESLPVLITYAPGQAVTSNSSFTITGTGGTNLTVTLTGTGLPAVSKFTVSPSTVNFGNVAVGHTVTRIVHVVNAGNQPSLMQRTALPGGPFGEPLRIQNELPFNGGYDLVLPVTFRPTKAGTFTGVYKLRWTDKLGVHTFNVPISGTGVG